MCFSWPEAAADIGSARTLQASIELDDEGLTDTGNESYDYQGTKRNRNAASTRDLGRSASTSEGMMSSFADDLARLRPAIETTLDSLLPSASEHPTEIHEAMRYSVFAGGKRIRPALVVMIGGALGADHGPLLPVAGACELVHTYSLIHDDLPAIDDDDLRRGRPSLHRQYDEATAILAGDALLTLGFRVLANDPGTISSDQRLQALQVMTEALGSHGMIGGQVDDLAAENRWPDDPATALDAIHDRKTGALLSACCRLGGIVAGVDDPILDTLGRLGLVLGRMFQIADDILDNEGSEELFGKTIGKDAKAHKLTYPALYGLRGSRERFDRLGEEALRLGTSLTGEGSFWTSLTHYFSSRQQ